MTTRLSRTKAVGGCVPLLVALLAFAAAPAAANVKFVALPDTQIYTDNRFPPGSNSVPVTDPLGTYRYFVDQTQWVADNAGALGIDFVIHLGDIVQSDDSADEWTRAKAALDIIDVAGIAYGTALGNHDTHEIEDGRPYYEMFVQDYGPQHFTGRPWYGGASPTGASSYQVVGDGSRQVLFLNLALAAPLEELTWADQILFDNRDKLAVVTTHAYMFDIFAAAGRYGEPLPGGLGAFVGDGRFDQFHGDAGKSAQEIYHEFIKSHPNIVMAQGGHFDADLYRLDGRNGADLPVLEIVSDYQSLRNGGDGYLRIYEFDFDSNQIHVQTYSPTLDRQRTTFEHFVNAVWLIWNFRTEVADALGISEAQAFAFLASQFKTDAVPGVDVVSDHPEYQADAAYYDQLMSDLFLGSIPAEVGVLADWESLWVDFFAADPSDPSDYGPSVRSPAFSVSMEFDRYTQNAVATRKQRACIVGMASKVERGPLLSRRNRHHERCIRQEGQGKLVTGVEACVDAGDPLLAPAEARSLAVEQKRCSAADEVPPFGFTGAADVNEVARLQSLGMLSDLFGPAPRTVASRQAETAAFRCQTRVAKPTNALLERMLRVALKRAVQDLETTPLNNADLALGMLAAIDADPDGVIERFRAKLGARVARHCHGPGVDVATHLPGECAGSAGDAAAFASCLERRARCRACLSMNAVHGSAISCDFYDDGLSVNLSCP